LITCSLFCLDCIKIKSRQTHYTSLKLNSMDGLIINYLLEIILNKQNVKRFYDLLTNTHYYCEDDFELKTNYGLLMFIDTLFLDKDGYYRGLQVQHALQCEMHQYIADNKLKIFHYVTFKASAHNDFAQLNLLITEFKKDNWIILFAYYIYDKAFDLLNSKDDCLHIKNKIYAIICNLRQEESAQALQVCDECENDCPICLDAMDANNSITTLCKHSFHSTCLYPMFDEAIKKNSSKPKISCPLCRADIIIKSRITFNETTHYCS